jgi:hypothetical protein
LLGGMTAGLSESKKIYLRNSLASQKVQSGQTCIIVACDAVTNAKLTGFFTKLLKTGAKKFLHSDEGM